MKSLRAVEQFESKYRLRDVYRFIVSEVNLSRAFTQKLTLTA